MTDLTALTEITAPTTDDLVYVVDAPSGAKNPRKCSIANLVASADIDAAKITSGTLPLARLTGTITTAELSSSAGITSGQLATGIDATKIADGSVTNSEFKYINTLTDNAQTQIDGKSPTAGNTSLTTTGAIGTGTWESTDVAVVHGGTGSSTASGARTALGVAIGSDVQIYNANTALTTNTLNDFAVPTASLALGTQKITGLVDGVATTDAATKGQVDVAQAGLDAKYSCTVATTANVTLSGEQTIDGVLTSTDRVLVKNQTSGAENGIYVSASGAWARSADANTSVEVTSGLYTLITEGTVSAGQGFVLVTADPITLDTTVLTFSQFSGVGDLIGGTGITKSGNTISVDASQTQITAIGTLTAGVLTGATGLPATTGLTATGTKDATTFLRGDDTWAVVDASPLTTKGDVYTFDTGNQRLAVGADGLVLKADSSTATGLVWGSGGGGATIVHTYTNTTDTTYAGTASTFVTSGVADRDIYIKKIDANNEGVFTKIFKNGAAVEVQIA